MIEVPSQNKEGAFSLKYKNRFLYSKYNPEKSVLAAIDSLALLPNSLLLFFSPALFLGWTALKKKAEENNCDILCVEADKALFDFAQKTINEKKIDARLLPFKENTPRGLDDCISKAKKKYKRVVRLDASAGVSINADFYKNFFECAQNIIAAYWKNRLTLVKLGRLYCMNVFKNLIPSAKCQPFSFYEKSVKKPILLCGAGESLDELTQIAVRDKSKTASEGKSASAAAARITQDFYVIAVDAALSALASSGIKMDAAVATESQLAIEKAYIGLGFAAGSMSAKQKKNDATTINAADANGPLFFFDLTSRSSIARRYENKAFYFSQFDENSWLRRLQENGLLPFAAPPLGSVGLTAVYLALRLRKDESVPVYALGLDFSFSAGRTHARGTAQSKALFFNSNRLSPPRNFFAALGPQGQKLLAKDNNSVWSSKNLMAYAALFKQFFRGAKNLFDAGSSGLDLGLEKKRLADIFQENVGQNERAASNDIGLENACRPSKNHERAQKARRYLESELKSLRELSDLLSYGEAAQSRDKSMDLGKQILAALEGREYLYLHFPDGTEASLERSFLTRVKSQTEFFAKTIKTALCAAKRHEADCGAF